MAWIRFTGTMTSQWDKRRKEANRNLKDNDPKRYRKIKLLSEDGASAKVFVVRDKKTLEKLAMKEAIIERTAEVTRESETYTDLGRHPNVLEKKGSFIDKNKRQCIVFPLMGGSLRDWMDGYEKLGSTIPQNTISALMFQLLRGANYIHGKGFAHRDLKPQNMLLKDGRLVICDLGCTTPKDDMSTIPPYIVTRWYRPPEVVFEKMPYGHKVDMWSLGCILAEMFLGGRPVFECSSGDALFAKQCQVMGQPSEEDWPHILPEGKERPNDVATMTNTLDETMITADVPLDARDLIGKLLSYSPNSRPDAIEAMGHRYFNGLRADQKHVGLFKNWTRAEVATSTSEAIAHAVPRNFWSQELIELFGGEMLITQGVVKKK